MTVHTFFCVDAHTCGNPVRVVAGGGPQLQGDTMIQRRAWFLEHYDWIRTGLMFEPRGHDMMSGCIFYPPTNPQCDIAILYIETSGCLPMCGHGTIGAVTVMIERGLVTPREPGKVVLDTPAGVVVARYRMEGARVAAVRLTNIASFLHSSGLSVTCPELGSLTVDVAYGGNFYAIVEPQTNYGGLDDLSVGDLVRISPKLRTELNRLYTFEHPLNPAINGLSHIQWTGPARETSAQARNAVFYGEKAIDRSPCGTGTSARMAQLVAHGELSVGDDFVHESIIGSLFKGRVAEAVKVGDYDGIIPEIEGWARMTGYNTIFIDDEDPYAHGFQVL